MALIVELDKNYLCGKLNLELEISVELLGNYSSSQSNISLEPRKGLENK